MHHSPMSATILNSLQLFAARPSIQSPVVLPSDRAAVRPPDQPPHCPSVRASTVRLTVHSGDRPTKRASDQQALLYFSNFQHVKVTF